MNHSVLAFIKIYFSYKLPNTMKTLTRSSMKEFKPIFSKKLIFLTKKEKSLLVETVPFLVIITLIFRVLGATNNFNFSSNILLISSITILIFTLFLLNGLFIKKKVGWILMCIFQAVLLIYDLSVGNLISGIVSATIGFWIVFQIKQQYN